MNLEELDLAEIVVLVADDLPSARRVIVRILNKLGFSKIVECASGTELLLILEQDESICLVICDRMMPDIEGTEVLEKVRLNKALAGLPFLLISSTLTEEDEQFVRGFKYALTIAKPFTAEALSAKLGKLFEAYANF